LTSYLFAALNVEFDEKSLTVEPPEKSKKSKNSSTPRPLFQLSDLKLAVQNVAAKGFLKTLLNALKIFLPVMSSF
jgi:hypothetical protein